MQGEGETEWKKICEISHEVAMDALGERGRPHPAPWLIGHEQDKKQMNGKIRKTKGALWSAKRGGQGERDEEMIEGNSNELKKLTKERRQKMRGQNRDFWQDYG